METGYKKKHFQMTECILDEYSKIFDQFPMVQKKKIEKLKSETVVKFIRFAVKKQVAKFQQTDFSIVEQGIKSGDREKALVLLRSTPSFLSSIFKGK